MTGHPPGFDPPPAWRMPEGVDAALWAYAASERLADEDAAYFEGHPLLEADLRWARERLRNARAVIDLGCGTGRAALALATDARWVVAVDLSWPMLRALGRTTAGRNIDCVRANVCAPLGFRPATFDAALLLFSTLGMLRGRTARRRALAEARRIVRPGGCLLLHAHNLAHNLRDPGGRRWLLEQAVARAGGQRTTGDRAMTYRGIPNLVVHQYRWRELAADLRASGWHIVSRIPLDAATAQRLRTPWILPAWRAGGWFVEACAKDKERA